MNETDEKITIDQLKNFIDFKEIKEKYDNLKNECENLKLLLSNNHLEISSYQEAMRQSFVENQDLKKKIQDLIEDKKNNEIFHKKIENLQNENNDLIKKIMNLKDDNLKISGKYNDIINENTYTQKENKKLQEKLIEYKELVSICEDLFKEDFEGILAESLGIITEKKIMKQKIHDIVNDCTSRLLGGNI